MSNKGPNGSYSDKISGIYQIKNIVNDKIYVGSSAYIQRRWAEHRSFLNRDLHWNRHLQFAWLKYGKENFEFKILEITANLLEREQFWLDTFKSYDSDIGYNISKITTGGGFNHTKEYIESISGEGNPFYGHKHNAKTIKILSDKAILAGRKPLKGLTGLSHPGGIYVYFLTSPEGVEYSNIESLVDFCNSHGLKHDSVRSSFNVGRTHHKGWKIKRMLHK